MHFFIFYTEHHIYLTQNMIRETITLEERKDEKIEL